MCVRCQRITRPQGSIINSREYFMFNLFHLNVNVKLSKAFDSGTTVLSASPASPMGLPN